MTAAARRHTGRAPVPAGGRRRLLTVLAVLAAAIGLLPAAAASAAEPSIDAPAAIVMEATTGDVAFEKAADERRPIASATKLMTALLTLESEPSLGTEVPATRYRALAVESKLGLTPGERLTEADLLRALLVASANDAAHTLAVHVAGSVGSFVRRMNRRAVELGLTNTRFQNPIGLDHPQNYSSARDLASLTRELRRFRFFRRTVDAEQVALESGSQVRTIANRNTLLARAPWVDGVKTGNTTQAGDVLVASGERRGVHVISVVLGAEDTSARDEQSLELLQYGFTRWERATAIRTGSTVTRVPIDHRAGAVLPLEASETVNRVLRKGERFGFEIRGVPDEVEGPVRHGDRIGFIDVTVRGEVVQSVPLVATLDVPAAGIGRRTQDFLTTPWTLAVVGAALLVSTLALRRRPPGRDERPRRPREEAAA